VLAKELSGSKFEECSKLRRNMHFKLPDHEEAVGLSNAAECGQIAGATGWSSKMLWLIAPILVKVGHEGLTTLKPLV